MKANTHVVIESWMIDELQLKGNDLLVYAIIYGFSQDGNSVFSGSLQYLADWCSATKQGIQKNLKNLLERELIKKETKTVNGSTLVAYYTTELHTIQLSCTNTIDNISNTSNQYNLIQDNNINNNNNNKEDTYKEKVARFIDDYNSICVSLPKCQRLSPKRSKAIVKLLKTYPYDDILTVFEKLEESDFCTNRKRTGWRADIDFILREDKFVSVLEGKYDNQTNSRSARSVEATSLREGEKAKRLSQEEKDELRRLVESGELEEF